MTTPALSAPHHLTRGQEDTGPDSNSTVQKWVSSSSLLKDAEKLACKWVISAATRQHAVDRIIFQSTAGLPQSVRARAKRSGGELTDSDQLSQAREAGGGDQRQKQKVVTAEQLSCTPVCRSLSHW